MIESTRYYSILSTNEDILHYIILSSDSITSQTYRKNALDTKKVLGKNVWRYESKSDDYAS